MKQLIIKLLQKPKYLKDFKYEFGEATIDRFYDDMGDYPSKHFVKTITSTVDALLPSIRTPSRGTAKRLSISLGEIVRVLEYDYGQEIISFHACGGKPPTDCFDD